MTDDELLARIAELQEPGDRGESPEVLGTATGDTLWALTHPTEEPLRVTSSVTYWSGVNGAAESRLQTTPTTHARVAKVLR